MTIDEMIAVLQAAKAGKTIECRPRSSSWHWEWEPYPAPCHTVWNFITLTYRVKREPRRVWIPVFQDGYGVAQSTHEAADRVYPDTVPIVEFVEVMK